MTEMQESIMVGLLGQWASGKSTASKTLVDVLGGPGNVVFLTDREILARRAMKHVFESGEMEAIRYLEEGGRQRIEGKDAIIWLNPGENPDTVDLNTLLFDLHDGVYDNVAVGELSWFDKVRLELGAQIREHARGDKPVVIEAGFGTNTQPRGANPFSHTLADLFSRLDEAGVSPQTVKWIVIAARYETRWRRNQMRLDSVPAAEFSRFAADGGDLDPVLQRQLEADGLALKRVPNDHDDLERFKVDIITAMEDLFRQRLPAAPTGP